MATLQNLAASHKIYNFSKPLKTLGSRGKNSPTIGDGNWLQQCEQSISIAGAPCLQGTTPLPGSLNQETAQEGTP